VERGGTGRENWIGEGAGQRRRVPIGIENINLAGKKVGGIEVIRSAAGAEGQPLIDRAGTRVVHLADGGSAVGIVPGRDRAVLSDENKTGNHAGRDQKICSGVEDDPRWRRRRRSPRGSWDGDDERLRYAAAVVERG